MIPGSYRRVTWLLYRNTAKPLENVSGRIKGDTWITSRDSNHTPAPDLGQSGQPSETTTGYAIHAIAHG